MSYNKICALSKKKISSGEKMKVLFLASDYFRYKSEDRSFFFFFDFVYAWQYFKIVGYPLSAINENSNEIKFKKDKSHDFLEKLLNKITGNNFSMEEILAEIFNGELKGEKLGKEFSITYMVLSEAAYENIISNNKKISYLDDDFKNPEVDSYDKGISYEESLREKENYLNLILNQKKEKILPYEKKELEENIESLLSMIEPEKQDWFKDMQLEKVLEGRFKTPVSQCPFNFINFAKDLKKNPGLEKEFAKGFTDNIWIAEYFDKLRMFFSPTPNVIDYNHNEEILLFYKEMVNILEKEISKNQYETNYEYIIDNKDNTIVINESEIFERLVDYEDSESKEMLNYYNKQPLKEGYKILDLRKVTENEELSDLLFESSLLPKIFKNKIIKVKTDE